ncbi:hypothetical protein CDG76_31975 [Nostoc sp. 'Peltigera membranacea cyanobiont' 210A]|uniref:hypothetical protein n=1 Tax=Nostoc sp. 'Peltigera membranacea cyanobiont' 210A TaxID=2014529 RepID=UPI000B952F9D|nr:hypothetical protein [Nostoc sp. 'Peltigera membranacea cyanobiont' 210A]OYD90337.1 hypothetical protein CDG76_31975 [Nostoc sp. 'Peltigera membranacea cyanobiont' 210A]
MEKIYRVATVAGVEILRQRQLKHSVPDLRWDLRKPSAWLLSVVETLLPAWLLSVVETSLQKFF